MIRLAFIFIFSGMLLKSFAGEGMWLPLVLDSLNFRDMQEKGLRLSPEDIYSHNQASLKDAIVLFGNGCTGELISPEGLLITNHHCGYSRIQSHSTLENNYLMDGFWAGSQTEELPNPGLSVTFLVRVEDVTSRVLADVSDSLAESDRMNLISFRMNEIRDEAIKNTHYQAEIKSFYFGLEYYLFVYEIYNDVRLVGTPPEAVGNFGGDTDNWIWPRHTGDFSLFRIYAGKDNMPADYSPDNVPYKPKKYLNISVSGVEEGDFTMILGYPARTDQYLTSEAIEIIAGKSFPAKIEMRTLRMQTLQNIMDRGPEFKLQYATKHKNIGNAWKKWIGVTKGVERANVVENKKIVEQEFNNWANNLKTDTIGYTTLMKDFSSLYNIYEPLFLANDIGGELLNSIELSSLVNRVQRKYYSLLDSSDGYKETEMRSILEMGSSFFKTSGLEIDRKVLPVLLRIYATSTTSEYHPAFYDKIPGGFNNNYEAYVNDLFEHSMFTDSVRYKKTFGKSKESISKRIVNDPLIDIYRDFSRMLLSDAGHKLDSLENELKRLYRKYVTGLMTMYPERRFYPDANFSMRLTYGKVQGYEPADAIRFSHLSTLDGIIEKVDPAIPDYKIPAELKELHNKADFGIYTENGKVPVCFLASNHTSGGNSGSPVLNASGDLIGINFDRNWEGTVSDYAYDPTVCRNISLDIRYVLFIIDKLADADWLLNELTINN